MGQLTALGAQTNLQRAPQAGIQLDQPAPLLAQHLAGVAQAGAQMVEALAFPLQPRLHAAH